MGEPIAIGEASTLSPWVITPEALEPFRKAQPARPDGDPLLYLLDDADQAAGVEQYAKHVLDCRPDGRASQRRWLQAATR